jgi:hypothetical protein
MMNPRTYAVGLVCLAACSPGTETAAVSVRDSAGIAIVHNDLERLPAVCAVDSIPTISIGTDSGETEYELNRVAGAARLSDGRIVLVNGGSSEIRFYDQRGRFLARAGRGGDGPGEFRDAYYVWALPGDTVWVGDYAPWQFLAFTPDARYVRTLRPTPQLLQPDFFDVLDNGRSVFGVRSSLAPPPGGGYQMRELIIMVHAATGELLDTIGVFQHGRRGRVSPSGPTTTPYFESVTHVDADGLRLTIGHGATPELTVYNLSGDPKVERLIRWTTGDRSISAADLDEARKRQLAEFATAASPFRELMVESEEGRPVADQFPAFTSVQMGRDGRIWIRGFVKPGSAARPPWIVLDREGQFLCRATVPTVRELLEFGADYVLAKVEDEFDVERVVQFSLGAPTRRD